MNILFMSLGEFADLSSGSVHIDLVRELSRTNDVFLVCKSEKNKGEGVGLSEEYGIHVLRVETGAIKTNNFITKGLSTLTLEGKFKKAIINHLYNVKFDLIIYTTPPITFVNPIRYIKKRDQARTYLMLKDIFPQNAVDIGVMKKTGLMSPLYHYFRAKEKALYRISDRIGCMSPANVEYIRDHNPEVRADKLEIFPNSIYVRDLRCKYEERIEIRTRYGIPVDKKVFVYGGNLGKPQGIPFLIECLKEIEDLDCYFLIVGNGTEFQSVESYITQSRQKNVRLLKGLPKADYDLLVSACDVGLIFLDHRFTIPNFPSRMLSYMQSHLPILAATDPNTDIGEVIVNGGFGWWCESNCASLFRSRVLESLDSDLNTMGENAYRYLHKNYNVTENCMKLIMKLTELEN